MLTQQQAYERYQNEPEYLVRVMIANNLSGLNQRALERQLGNGKLDADQMFDLFDKLARSEQYQEIAQLVNGVEYAPNKLTKGNDRFHFEQFSPLMNQAFVGPPTEEEFWEQYEGAGEGDWWTDFDWGGVLDGVGGIINVFSNWGADDEQPDYSSNPNPNPNPNPNENSRANSNVFSTENLKTYGPWFLLLVLVGWLAYRGKL